MIQADSERESNEALDARLTSELPFYDVAKSISSKMMFANDDGSWAGELDPVRRHINVIFVLARELKLIRDTTIEDCARVAAERAIYWETGPEGREFLTAENRHVANLIRALKDKNPREE